MSAHATPSFFNTEDTEEHRGLRVLFSVTLRASVVQNLKLKPPRSPHG